MPKSEPDGKVGTRGNTKFLKPRGGIGTGGGSPRNKVTATQAPLYQNPSLSPRGISDISPQPDHGDNAAPPSLCRGIR